MQNEPSRKTRSKADLIALAQRERVARRLAWMDAGAPGWPNLLGPRDEDLRQKGIELAALFLRKWRLGPRRYQRWLRSRLTLVPVSLLEQFHRYLTLLLTPDVAGVLRYRPYVRRLTEIAKEEDRRITVVARASELQVAVDRALRGARVAKRARRRDRRIEAAAFMLWLRLKGHSSARIRDAVRELQVDWSRTPADTVPRSLERWPQATRFYLEWRRLDGVAPDEAQVRRALTSRLYLELEPGRAT